MGLVHVGLLGLFAALKAFLGLGVNGFVPQKRPSSPLFGF